MLFNSLDFALFFPVVFALYWFVAKDHLKWQNLLLLVASYFFYACWDWRFLFLLMFSTVLDYYTGLQMYDAKSQRMKRFWFWLSVGINLGFLGIFKYYNFFAESLAASLSAVGFHADFWTLQVILPVGISFYTFHGLSYVIDIYKDRIKPERNFVDYSVFVSFFPLLVAGPIERATHLLPQIQSKRVFDRNNAVDGLKQVLWGLFKKVVIADNCAEYVNMVFANSENYSASTHAVAAIFFAFQIYGDFSGYSDIALGTARLLGIDLLRNFSYPYFSRDIAEFWRRWHISLSTWFRDYLYIPLGGSKGGDWMRIRNTFIIFLVSGFWHGANWTFIVWGLLHALFIMPSVIFKTNRNNLEIVAAGRIFPKFKDLTAIVVTFGLTVFAWIFFRADSLAGAFQFIGEMFNASMFSKPEGVRNTTVWMIVALVVVEWLGREQKYGIAKLVDRWPLVLRWLFYYTIVFLIFEFRGSSQQFIYFQF
ncbi:MBOAT family O-acyltransferase [Flavobacterium caeni]|uniref:D-alanyl-lipoteichoic acid acyltransferase DltB, MBOAT superfamily n=1 Tax=Flavobacterium caeni TaxID=490189 RepID=A0A1G5AWB2_9FLAO|nr:MBOAT family O-acyltransferase [Flavobacterium caeni]SCX82120.1 D-alanyl-lipoteichoic acid acyltransferase DltB, MBOAT superfamily [Flavobacterium caeni]